MPVKLPGIRGVRFGENPERAIESMREILEVKLGRKGNPGDSLVTKDELIAAGVLTPLPDDSTYDDAPTSAIATPDYAIPLPPSTPSATSGTSTLIKSADGTIISRIKFTWVVANDLSVSFYETEFKPTALSAWIPGTSTNSNTDTFVFFSPVEDLVVYDMRVRSAKASGKVSEWLTLIGHPVAGKSEPPFNVQNFRFSIKGYSVLLEWNDNQESDVSQYEIRQGAIYSTSTFVALKSSLSHSIDISGIGNFTYWIRAKDGTPTFSLVPSQISVVITPSTITGITAQVIDNNVLLQWSATAGTLPIDRYEIRKGAVFATATVIAQVAGTFTTLFETLASTYTYWIVALDMAKNPGTPLSTVTIVNQPPDYILRQNWLSALYGTKTNVYTGLVVIRSAAVAAATSTTVTLDAGASAVDGAYNGATLAIIAGVGAGQNSIISAYNGTTKVATVPAYNVIPIAASTYAINTTNVVPRRATAPVNITETYAAHFTSRAWATPAAQVAAGYPVFIMPVPLTSQYSEIFDYGATLPVSQIIFEVNSTVSVGSVTLSPTISVATAAAPTTWVDIVGVYKTYQSNFRYVKVTLDVTPLNDKSIVVINEMRIKLELKMRSDSGAVQALSTDANGTTVLFTQAFTDVESIVLTSNNIDPATGLPSTIPVTLIYDFADIPNPTFFRVLAYNSTTGARLSRLVSWVVRGT